jgi:hypothetical protein
MVTLVNKLDGGTNLHPSFSAVEPQRILHALAMTAAAKGLPLQYAGYLPDSLDREDLAPLSFVDTPINAEVVAALQQSLRLLAIRCIDFELRHWDILCSLHRVIDMTLSLGTSRCSEWPAYEVQHMQLTSLRKLSFEQCGASLQPMLAHLSALTLLTGLHFDHCSHGWSAVSAGMPPLHSLIHLTLQACDLRVLPPLAQLVRLETLNLDNNPNLRDVQRGWRGLTSLCKLSMRSSTPISEDTLIAVEYMPALWEFDVDGHKWTPRTASEVQRRLRHVTLLNVS